MKLAATLLSLSVLVLGACALAPPAEVPAPPDVEVDPGTPWIADPRDNVCGLSEPRHLSAPARIDYARALEATPSMREMRARKIAPGSARGRIYFARAENELCSAAREVRELERHCSVWKRIRHRDGRGIPDCTDAIEAVLSGAGG